MGRNFPNKLAWCFAFKIGYIDTFMGLKFPVDMSCRFHQMRSATLLYKLECQLKIPVGDSVWCTCEMLNRLDSLLFTGLSHRSRIDPKVPSSLLIVHYTSITQSEQGWYMASESDRLDRLGFGFFFCYLRSVMGSIVHPPPPPPIYMLKF